MPTQTGALHGPPWCPLHHLRLHEGGYEVASDQTSAQWFRVVVDVHVCSNGAYPNVATVYVFFKYVTVNSQHNTWVNGQNVSLPSTPAKQLSVSIANRTVVIERDSGVRVTYSISQELFVTLDNLVACYGIMLAIPLCFSVLLSLFLCFATLCAGPDDKMAPEEMAAVLQAPKQLCYYVFFMHYL